MSKELIRLDITQFKSYHGSSQRQVTKSNHMENKMMMLLVLWYACLTQRHHHQITIYYPSETLFCEWCWWHRENWIRLLCEKKSLITEERENSPTRKIMVTVFCMILKMYITWAVRVRRWSRQATWSITTWFFKGTRDFYVFVFLLLLASDMCGRKRIHKK